MHLDGHCCGALSPIRYVIETREMEAGNSGLRTKISVQDSLAMSSIHKGGSEAQKNHWLPLMASDDVIGWFGLTEPAAGSDPSSLITTALS